MLGKIESYVHGGNHRNALLLVVYDDFRNTYDELKDKEVEVNIKQHRNKRSKSANAYMWTLINQIALATRIPKEDVYIELIKRVGITMTVTVATKDADAFCRSWETQGLGWVAERLTTYSDTETDIECYRGSSAYDTREFNRLLDEVIYSCKELGIDTATPNEIARLKALYEEEYNRKGS